MSRKTYQRIVALAITAGLVVGGIFLFGALNSNTAESEAIKVLSLIREGKSQESYSRLNKDITDSKNPEEWAIFVNALEDKIGKDVVLAAKNEDDELIHYYGFETNVGKRTYSYQLDTVEVGGQWEVSYIAPSFGEFDKNQIQTSGESI